jgi:Uncharacterized conserved protein (DUF2277)
MCRSIKTLANFEPPATDEEYDGWSGVAMEASLERFFALRRTMSSRGSGTPTICSARATAKLSDSRIF